MDGSVSFNRNWKDYAAGFGDIAGEFWLGNDMISALTQCSRHKLRIDMESGNGTQGYAEYDNFRVAGAKDNYTLESMGQYSGDAGDSLHHTAHSHWDHLGQQFSTPDVDNDARNDPGKYKHCAKLYRAGWWFNKCYYAGLNNVYGEQPKKGEARSTLSWNSWMYDVPLQFVEMKIQAEE